jgi:predicted permease
MIAGREFRDDDSPAVSPSLPDSLSTRPQEGPGPRVAIVNESFARHFFAGRNPIGMHICRDESYNPATAYEVVGVVADAHYFGLREALEAMIYVPVWRDTPTSRVMCLRTAGQPPALGDAIHREVSAIDPAVPVMNVRTIEQNVDNNILEDRLLMSLSGFFGVLALLLAAVGLYGVISFAVTRRTREIGIRMALGAERGSVVWLVGRYAAALVATGAAIGVVGALALTKLIRSFLFGITPQDPAAIAVATVVLAGAAALACYVPARRATQVDPIVALRQD